MRLKQVKNDLKKFILDIKRVIKNKNKGFNKLSINKITKA